MQPQAPFKVCPRCGQAQPIQSPACPCGHQFRTHFAPPHPNQTQAFAAPQPPAYAAHTSTRIAATVWAQRALIGIAVIVIFWFVGRLARVGQPSAAQMAAKLHVDMTEMQVSDVIGQPTSKIDLPTDGQRWLYEADKELRVDFLYGKLVATSTFQEPSGGQWARVTVGQSPDEVAMELGQPDSKSKAQGSSGQFEEDRFGPGAVRFANGTVVEACPQGCQDTDWLTRKMMGR